MEIKRMNKKIVTLSLLSICFVVVMVLAISIGPITIPFKHTIFILLNKLHISTPDIYTNKEWIVVMEVRLPRVLIGSLVGAALAVSGTAMQGLFRNPLVEPGFIGVSSGAAFGAVCALFFGWVTFSAWALPIAAFSGAIVALLTILLVWKASKVRSVAMLLLLGIGINAFFSSLMNVFIASSKNEQELRSAIYWLQGGLEARTWEHVFTIVGPIIIGSIILMSFGRQLNVMLLGEEQAKSSGINIRLTRNIVLGLVALITGSAVAVSGVIGFVGLVVPHMLRFIIGSDHRILMPASALGGAMFLILADLLSRMILQPITLQVGTVSAIIGAPLFILLILRSKRGMGI